MRDVEAIREHYALTLRHWVRTWRLEGGPKLVSPGRARIWRLYMAASALSFERNRIGVNQILAVEDTGERGLGDAAAGPYLERLTRVRTTP